MYYSTLLKGSKYWDNSLTKEIIVSNDKKFLNSIAPRHFGTPEFDDYSFDNSDITEAAF